MAKKSQLLKYKELRPSRSARSGCLPLWAALLLLWLMTLAADAANFTATLDRSTITLGENATLTLTFDGGAPKVFPAFPAIPNLQIIDQGQSTQISFANGVTSALYVRTYALTPTQAGEINLPAFRADIGGQIFSTPPLKLTVLNPGASAPPNNGNPEFAFVKLVLPRSQLYVGEITTLTEEVYVQDLSRVRNFQPTPLQAEGFTVGKILNGQQRQVQVGSVMYTMVPLNMSLTAAKAGTLSLGPAECSFDEITAFNFFGQPAQGHRDNVASEPITVKVVPLPRDNVPPGFSGGVGGFNLSYEVSPTNIAIGDPLSVKVGVIGPGADAVTLPDQPGWQQFKVYPPTSDFQPADQAGVNGTKNFVLTVVPQSMDINELPPFFFSYFDPDQKTYRTITEPAVPLIVRPSAASLPPPAAATTESNSPAPQDIVHIKPRLGALAKIQPPLVWQPWFIALQGLPILAWASLLFVRVQKERLANNPRLRRQREVEHLVRQGLSGLRRSAGANDREAFFATLFRLLQEQLGERLDLPASAITEAAVEEHLRPKKVPEPTLTALRELFQTCNQARYARQGNSQELVSLIPKVEAALNELKKIKA